MELEQFGIVQIFTSSQDEILYLNIEREILKNSCFINTLRTKDVK